MTPSGDRTLANLGSSFGAATVGRSERRAQVRAVFERVAPRYDLMNDLMSFGLHRGWKRLLVQRLLARLGAVPGPVLDLAGGTGDVALRLARRLPGREIVVVDPSPAMLARARQRGGTSLRILVAEAEALPVPDSSVAAVTLAFGLRNVSDPGQALAEIARVLRPGGVLALLEFSEARAWFRPLYRLHARLAIPTLGAIVARDPSAYRYLIDSIRRFPDATTMTAELAAAGLGTVELRRPMQGVVALHLAVKSREA